MRDRPTVDDLLAAARRSVQEHVLPNLPPAVQREAMMIASALAIARRMATVGEHDGQAGLHSLARLYPTDVRSCGEDGLLRRFVNDIRRGNFDAAGARRVDAWRWLWADALARVALVNPHRAAEAAADAPTDERFR